MGASCRLRHDDLGEQRQRASSRCALYIGIRLIDGNFAISITVTMHNIARPATCIRK